MSASLLHENALKMTINKYVDLGYNLISKNKALPTMKNYRPDAFLESDEDFLVLEVIYTHKVEFPDLSSLDLGKPVRRRIIDISSEFGFKSIRVEDDVFALFNQVKKRLEKQSEVVTGTPPRYTQSDVIKIVCRHYLNTVLKEAKG